MRISNRDREKSFSGIDGRRNFTPTTKEYVCFNLKSFYLTITRIFHIKQEKKRDFDDDVFYLLNDNFPSF